MSYFIISKHYKLFRPINILPCHIKSIFCIIWFLSKAETEDDKAIDLKQI